MRLEEITKNKIREQFHSPEFQDYMFEMICGESRDEDGIPYRQLYTHELIGIENDLIHMADSFIRHNIPMNRNCIICFILVEVVDRLIGDNVNCNNIKFFGLCNQLYYMIFQETSRYYQKGIKTKGSIFDEEFTEKEKENT